MHPDKFLGRTGASTTPAMPALEKAERIVALGCYISEKRKDAVDARKNSGIEDVWLTCEESYLGIDDMNRAEFTGAKWAKPMSMSGPLTSTRVVNDTSRSNAFVRLTSQYVDFAAAKLCEITLPMDDKAFSFTAMPNPELIKQLDNQDPMLHPATGEPMLRPLQPGEAPPPAPAAPVPQPMQPAPGQQPAPSAPGAPPQMVPATTADLAQLLIDQANDIADKAEQRIYGWMVESKYPREARKVMHDAARIGAGVMKGPFPEVVTDRAMTKDANGAPSAQINQKIVPSMCWTDPWNIYPDDACGEDIGDGDYIFERAFLSEKMLRKLKDQPGYLGDQIDAVIEQGPGKLYAEGGSPNDKKNRKRYEIWYFYGVIKREDLEASASQDLVDTVPADQQEVHVVVSMVNDIIIRVIINPLDSGDFPYRAVTWSRRPGHWAGVGVAEQISMPQRMCNAATRALLNNAGISAGPQIIIDQMALTPANGTYTVTPNKFWYTTAEGIDVTKAFVSIDIPNVQAQIMPIIQYAMKSAEQASGITLVIQGQDGAGLPETFGAAELQDANSHTWLRSVAYRFDDQLTEPLVQSLYEWLLLAPDVPDNEKGDFEINAHGSVAMVERSIQEQVLMGLLQAATNPAFMVDPAKLFTEYLKAKRLDPRKIQYTEEEQAQHKQMLASMPPPQIMLQQAKTQGAIQLQQAKANAELAMQQQDMAHEQNLLQTGGATPHQAQAMAKVAQARIQAQTAQSVEQSRANAELARVQKEQEIAQQNGQFDIQKMQLQKDIAMLQYANEQKVSLQQAQTELANTAMQEQTKRQLAAAELQMQANDGADQRAHEVNLANQSAMNDHISDVNARAHQAAMATIQPAPVVQ